MSEPILTVLKRISDQPGDLSPFAIASWCGKAADEIERLRKIEVAARNLTKDGGFPKVTSWRDYVDELCAALDAVDREQKQ